VGEAVKRVQRWRYYCDFCKKAGNSGFHLKKHEASCTLNPGRVCRMCAAIDGEQATMSVMLGALPDPEKFMVTIPAEYERGFVADDWLCVSEERAEIDAAAIKPALEIGMKALRDLTNNCPACILAALRQKGIPVPMVDGFDFKAELAEFWSEFNNARAEREDERARYYG
jgi:hypothetical protein